MAWRVLRWLFVSKQPARVTLALLNRRFDDVDRRFDDVDRRFDDVDRRFEAVDQRFDALEQELAQKSDRAELARKPDRSELMTLHEEAIGEVRKVAEGVGMLSDKLDDIGAKVSRVGPLESDLQMVKAAYGDLNRRVTRLESRSEG